MDIDKQLKENWKQIEENNAKMQKMSDGECFKSLMQQKRYEEAKELSSKILNKIFEKQAEESRERLRKLGLYND